MFKAYSGNDNNIHNEDKKEIFLTHENVNEINDYQANRIINSDSSDEYIDKKKISQKRYKKRKIKSILKKYLSDIPNIDSDKFCYKNCHFIYDVPKDKRDDCLFIDKVGNKYLSRYGSIYEKHIPKYKSQDKIEKKILKKSLENRYFRKLVNLQAEKIKINWKNYKKSMKENLDFIPLAFDQIDEENSLNFDDIWISEEIKRLNELVYDNHNDINLWRELVNLQDQAALLGFKKSGKVTKMTVAEKKLSILDKALHHNSGNVVLLLLKLDIAETLWLSERLETEWERVLMLYGDKLELWKAYLNYCHKPEQNNSVEKISSAYGKCFTNFYNIMTGRNRSCSIEAEYIYQLCDLLAEFCDYLAFSGYLEKALAIWQANIEYNLFTAHHATTTQSMEPSNCGSIVNDEIYQCFQRFWHSSQQNKIGEPQCKGWSYYHNQLTDSANWYFNQNLLQQTMSLDQDTVQSNPNQYGNQLHSEIQRFLDTTEHQMICHQQTVAQTWIFLENTRSLACWLPFHQGNDNEEHRSVDLYQIQPFLVTLHNPRIKFNTTPFDRSRAQRQLIGMYLAHLHVRPLIDCAPVAYSSQLALDPHLIIKRHGLPNFIRNSFDLLRQLPDSVQLYYQELSYHFSMCLFADNPKQAFTSMKQATKHLFQNYPSEIGHQLWLNYCLLLIQLPNHRLFKQNNKPMKIIQSELEKISTNLMQQITNLPQLTNQLQLLLVKLYHWIFSYKLNPQVLPVIDPTMIYHLTRCIFANVYKELSVKDNQSISQIIDYIDCLIDRFIDSDTERLHLWHYLMVFRSFFNIYQLNLDVEKFLISWSDGKELEMLLHLGDAQTWNREYQLQLRDYLIHLAEMLKYVMLPCNISSSSSTSSSQSFSHINLSNYLRQYILEPIFAQLYDIASVRSLPQLIDNVFSLDLLHHCFPLSRDSCGQTNLMPLRNFIWRLISTTSCLYQLNSNDSGLTSVVFAVEIELNSYHRDTCLERVYRVQSIFSRVLKLQCINWRYKLKLYLDWMHFESTTQQNEAERIANIRKVFYQSVTDLPHCKSLYLAGVSLIPDLLQEAVQLIKDRRVRLCTTLEEVELIRRIRESRNQDIQN